MKTCLIVEDSALIREIASRIVKEMGFQPKEAADAAEAVSLCGEGKVDAVLLDWDLPAFGGLDFLRGLGAAGGETRPPIILCATEYDAEQFALAKAAGAAFHILKPFDAQSIREAFEEAGVLEKSAASQAGEKAAG